ncbi:MAG TPA: hypothetical protein DHN33_03450 [Eubacteriaceae bacterium]|nr:hypothetical protein [Eubacteriaceae bacterium]
MIRIALSYKIIKKNGDESPKTRQLGAKDVSEYIKKEQKKQTSDGLNNEEQNSEEHLREEIRKELQAEIEKKREEILEMARQEAVQIGEKARQKASAEGYQEGLQKGYEEAERQTKGMKQQAVKLFEKAKVESEEYLKANENRLIDLSVKIAEKIVHQTIDESSDNLMLLARPILQEFVKSEQVIVSTHPDNVDFIRGFAHDIEKMCPNAHVLILEDGNLERNGMVIENEERIVDLQIRKQLDRFLELVHERELDSDGH